MVLLCLEMRSTHKIDCNADILIEQEGKDDNPHKRKFVENNEKYLGIKWWSR